MIDYKKISRSIFFAYVVSLLFVVALIALCELNMIPMEGLLIDGDGTVMYVIEVAMFFVVGLGLLATLKGFHWCLHHKVLVEEGKRRSSIYTCYSYIRIGVLAALMSFGVCLYYATLENWGLYYGLAAFVASLFCLPSVEGVRLELTMDADKE